MKLTTLIVLNTCVPYRINILTLLYAILPTVVAMTLNWGGAKGSEEYSTGIAKWNRLKGGRREKYYSLRNWGGGRTIRGKIQKILQAGTGFKEELGRQDTVSQRGGGTKLEAPTWDVAPPQLFFDELFRVSKNQIIWGGNYFSLPPTRCFLVWKKTNIAEGFSMAMCEYAWTSFKGNAKVFDYSSLRKENSGKFHPTEKPQELYAWTYKLFVDKNQTVFDPMMGSQASRVVAYKMGIDYIGCEIDKYYFDKGCEFFNRECLGTKKTENGKSITQLNLF